MLLSSQMDDVATSKTVFLANYSLGSSLKDVSLYWDSYITWQAAHSNDKSLRQAQFAALEALYLPFQDMAVLQR